MDQLLDKLRVLNYKEKCLKPSRYFSQPQPAVNEQFYAFVCIFFWLARLSGDNIQTPKEFDDPNATVQTMAQLRQPHGSQILAILSQLADKALSKENVKLNKIVWAEVKLGDASQITIEQDTEDLEVTEEDFDMGPGSSMNMEEDNLPDHEGDVSMGASPVPANTQPQQEDNWDDAPMQRPKTGAGTKPYTAMRPTTASSPIPPALETNAPQRNTIRPSRDPREWALECERVTPFLKTTVAGEQLTWKMHWESMTQYQSTIEKITSAATPLTKKMTTDLLRSLEKVQSRERYINSQFTSHITEFRSVSEKLSEARKSFEAVNSKVQAESTDLVRVTDELDGIKSHMDDLGSNLTDPKTVKALKEARERLRRESCALDVRLGVAQHMVWSNKLKDRGLLTTAGGDMDPSLQMMYGQGDEYGMDGGAWWGTANDGNMQQEWANEDQYRPDANGNCAIS